MINKDGIILQPVELTDYPFLVKWGNQRGLVLQSQTKRKTNAREQKEYIAKINKTETRQAFVVFLNDGEKPPRVGICELYNIDHHNRTCFINVYIEDKKNIMAVHGFKILQSLLEYIFYRIGLYKVSVELLLEQGSEITLFKQHDFEIEVRKRKHAFVGGSYKTVVELALSKPKFEKK